MVDLPAKPILSPTYIELPESGNCLLGFNWGKKLLIVPVNEIVDAYNRNTIKAMTAEDYEFARSKVISGELEMLLHICFPITLHYSNSN